MQRRHSRAAAATSAIAAGALAAFALKPSHGTTATAVAARNPAVEVRTQVIRRTIHIVRHEHAAALPRPRGPAAVLGAGAAPARVHTGASGAHSVAPATGAALATRTSGSHGTGAGSPGAPVSTRTSGATGGSFSRPVTRTSGAGGAGHGDGGDGGDGNGGADN